MGIAPAPGAAAVTLHALGWLAVANLVGMLLATLLLAPRLGDSLQPLGYGRWMPLHLDLQLYGWCALPLVGLLLRLYLPPGATRAAGSAVAGWSAALAFGAVSWLAGGSSGKLFLDWSGPARVVLVVAMGLLALLLGVGLRGRLALPPGQRPAPRGRLAEGGRVALLAVLATVPALLWVAAGPGVYPPVNPRSGGATGGSLVGSSLGIVAVFWLLPFALGLVPDDRGRVARRTLVALGLHLAWFLLLDHGDRSHHEPAQIAALAALAAWPPLVAAHLRRFRWPRPARTWLVATGVWSVVLVASGIVGFLPGVLEAWKFTNALVAHAHAAMAGVITSLGATILVVLGGGHGGVLGGRASFVAWHAGCAVHVAALLALGTLEGLDPGIVIRSAPASQALYVLRWGAGSAMTAASVAWLVAAWRAAASRETPPLRTAEGEAAA